MTATFEEDVLRLICGYVPQGGRSVDEKKFFMMSRKMSEICIVLVI